jgi:hypothetical protein
MSKTGKIGARRCPALGWLLFLLTLLCSSLGVAQAPTQQTPPQTAPPAQASTEHRITPEEAKQLLGAVDTILKFDSERTQLPILHPIKRQLVDRDEVEEYVETHLREDESAQRLKQAAEVLKKFGLLPRDFDLENFLVELLREQVAGYYDAKTKTVNLLDWLPPGVQLPVMAHELTHALQDQNFGLEKWTKAAEPHKKDDPGEEIASDEELAARQAIIEGQAMAVMIDYVLAPVGGSVVDSPLIVQAIQHGMMDTPGSTVLRSAPPYLRGALLFPYDYGLTFIRELLVKGGKERAYAGVFRDPPQDTLQVMDPASYLAGRRVPPLPLPDFDALLGRQYQRFDTGAVGAFDVSMLVQQYGSEEQAKRLWPQWRGGYYCAAKKRGGKDQTLAVVYLSRWASGEAAGEFARIYGSSFAKRYKLMGKTGGHEAAGGSNGEPAAAPGIQQDTSEGQVSLEVHGDYVLVLESFEPAVAERIRDAVLTLLQPAPARPQRAGRLPRDSSNVVLPLSAAKGKDLCIRFQMHGFFAPFGRSE